MYWFNASSPSRLLARYEITFAQFNEKISAHASGGRTFYSVGELGAGKSTTAGARGPEWLSLFFFFFTNEIAFLNLLFVAITGAIAPFSVY